MPKLDIITVNWNAGPQLRACLESVVQADKTGFKLARVVVVDNASSDGSADGLDDLALPLVVLHNEANLGFGKACNKGASASEADYLLFLNPDTRLEPGTLRDSIAVMGSAEHVKTGILGAQLIDEAGQVARSCARFPRPRHFWAQLTGLSRLGLKTHRMDAWDHAESRFVDHVMGSYYLIRRALFVQLGGFDERFFLYLEDLDLSLRAVRLGWHSYYYTGVKLFHVGGGTSRQVKARRLFYSLHSRHQYAHKHFSHPAALLLDVGMLCIEPFARLGQAVLHRSATEVSQTLKGVGLMWRWLLLKDGA